MIKMSWQAFPFCGLNTLCPEAQWLAFQGESSSAGWQFYCGKFSMMQISRGNEIVNLKAV